MDIKILIANRLSLQANRNNLYNITKQDIQNLSELNDYIKNNWNKVDEYKKYKIIQVLGGNHSGKGKNLKLVENYINSLTHEVV